MRILNMSMKNGKTAGNNCLGYYMYIYTKI